MASNDHSETDTDNEDEEFDSGYFKVERDPDIHVRPIKASSLTTKEQLKNELDNYKRVNEQLRSQIFKLDHMVQLGEMKLRREKTFLEDAKKGERVKDVKLQEARIKMDNLVRRNSELLAKISSYENSIRVLEKNKRELLTKPKDEETNKLIVSESSKTKTTEGELLSLKQRIRDMANKLEEKNKTIAMHGDEQSKMNAKFEQNMNEVKAVKHLLEEGKEREEKMANKVDNMEGMMKGMKKREEKMANKVDNMEDMLSNVLAQVQALGQKSPSNDQREEHKIQKQLPNRQQRVGANYRRGGQQAMNISRLRRPGLPPLENPKSKEVQGKTRWKHP